ncbi:MAG TPA: heme exporter protein CcmD [Telluria sp.]
MSWASWSEFAAMGGYGPFVWGSFGMVLLLLAVEVVALGRRRRAAMARLRGAERGA